MNEYMVTIRFINSPTEEFFSLIPEQRAQVNTLMEKGVLTSYSLSFDRSTLWLTILGASEETVKKTLRMMPLYKFMEFSIIELMFHNHLVQAPMRFSIN